MNIQSSDLTSEIHPSESDASQSDAIQSETSHKRVKTQLLDNTSIFTDELKKNSTSMINFIITLFIIVIVVCLHFYIGALVFYQCKLGQSNILPTDINCFPYTNTKPVIDPIQMNVFTNSGDPPLSAKLSFPYDNYNAKNFLIDIFRNYDQIKSTNNYILNLFYIIYIIIATYLISIYYGIIQFYYYCINIVFNLINHLSEPLILIFGPLLVPILLSIVGILQIFYFIFLWFVNMIYLFNFKKHEELFVKLGFKGWKIIPLILSLIISFSSMFTFFILFFIVFFFILPGVTPLLHIIMILSCFFYKGLIDGEKVGVFTFVKELFKVHKPDLMFLISIIVMIMAFVFFGFWTGLITIILLLLIYYGKIGINLFDKSDSMYNLSVLSSNDMANKSCI